MPPTRSGASNRCAIYCNTRRNLFNHLPTQNCENTSLTTASPARSPVSSSSASTAQSAQTLTASSVTPLSSAERASFMLSSARTQQLRWRSLVSAAADGSKLEVPSRSDSSFPVRRRPEPSLRKARHMRRSGSLYNPCRRQSRGRSY